MATIGAGNALYGISEREYGAETGVRNQLRDLTSILQPL
jgi:hypothetical protein